MKIRRVETIPVRVPLKPGMATKTAHGEHVFSQYVIVKIHTDNDLIGLGEATVMARWSGETRDSVLATIEQLLAPALIGKDPRQITTLRAVLDDEIKLNPFTKAAIEMALWDLKGKALNAPIYELLGGKLRDAIPMKMVVGAFEVPKAVELARKFLDSGVGCIKVKVGLDPIQDVERVRAIRQLAGPLIPITIDANCGWSYNAACWALKQLEEIDLRVAEQPIRAGDPNMLAALRRTTRVPIMADESVFTLTDAWAVLSAGAADVISIYPGKNGGIAAAVEIAHAAKAAGAVCHIGSNLELGVGSASMLHLAAAIDVVDSVNYPSDILGPLYHVTDLLTKPLNLGPRLSVVPEGPGLGVELSDELVEQYRDR